MSEAIKAELRTVFGKGSARQTRRDGNVPAVIYGHGQDPVHIVLDYHTTYMAVRGQANAVLTLDIDGKEELVLVKDKQRNPLTRLIEHIDFLRVKKGEKVEVEVPVEVTGESFSGTIHLVEVQTIRLLAPATSIPENVVVDVEGLTEGSQITVADLKVASGIEVLEEAETVIVNVVVPAEETDEEAPAAEEASEEAAE